ncbi:hypothetical protein Tsubulata_033218 [Turnera subulata]|uniref:Helicase ATP-binding domain-containing protein n=1 Tax=Turnera subulata TaxID=218843 RepID=A0A9Q0F6U1_9ROSI|nr:hypothetical protein Tsubulata_033218 [Turnera subulata]
MELEDDDWGLSAEELDSLERDALHKIAQQQQQQQQRLQFPPSNQNPPIPDSCNKPISDFPSTTVQSLSSSVPTTKPGQSLSTPFILTEAADASPKRLPKLSVKFFLHATGNIAAKFPYDPVLVGAFRKVPKATWNAKERLWIFPVTSLSSAEKALNEASGLNVEVENLDTLVVRAISAASAVPDLRDWYARIPENVESKLLPFQRDGVRFMLQHGGRALLADEMGLGKTLQANFTHFLLHSDIILCSILNIAIVLSLMQFLGVNTLTEYLFVFFQAIAVTACVPDAWPVLIIAPSSLRLHWASVVLSQWSGSNRGGYNIVPSNTKGQIDLNGVFNIISYDMVPKLQNTITESSFKVVIADESHFLKNAQAKRTTACLPVIKKAQYAILLSGTPALSRPIELFKQLEALYPDVYKNVHEYGNRYCKGGMFGVYQGASNHEELHNLMKSTVMIRRLKKDVLAELPVKRRQQVFLDLAENDMKQINALFRELEVIKGKIKACISKEDIEALKFAEKNIINKIYTDSADAKISGVLDYLGTVIEAGCKFLIFAHHQSMIDSIHKFLLVIPLNLC